MTSQDERDIALQTPSCPYCGATLTQQQVFRPGHCGAEPCFLAHITAGQKKLKSQREDVYADRQDTVRTQAKDAITSAATIFDCAETDVVVAVVPYQNEPLAPLSDTQRDAFIEHVTDATKQAFAVDPDAGILDHYDQKTQDEPSIVDAGCAACQGHCCKRGGGKNHAFITRQSIYYILENNPDLTQEQVVDHFVSALPDQSVQGACVFQGEKGCTLTRDWRASLCNTFLCHDIFAMHDVTQGRLDAPLVIAGINDDALGSVGTFDIDTGLTPLKTKALSHG